ncbi:P-type phospholipid transporter [Malassezia cuniculi]|uniref:Phospholipid-transporting ATPase n=1 Tax=Malassezia cuniculi TaxID=948313 RepID=A0AAF0JB68_9BASI|nr:P-type phospholipid transporter [Malassezia cuniculi]
MAESAPAQGAEAAPRRGFMDSVRHAGSATVRFFKRIDLNPETAFQRKRPPPAARHIYVNMELPEEAYDHKGRTKQAWVFSTNQVISAKYTAYNFVFKNLLEQFRRVANLFFLVLVILQFFPEFTTISPGVAMLPLLFVLAITMLKDGYEDIKRHQSDRAVNREKVLTLRGGDWKNHNVTELKSRSLSIIWFQFMSYFRPNHHKGEAHDDHDHDHDAHGDDEHQQIMSPQRVASPVDMGDEHNNSRPHSRISTDRPHSRMSTDRPQSRLSLDRSQSRLSNDLANMHAPKAKSTRRQSTLINRLNIGNSNQRWKTTLWEDVHVGDLVLVRNNEHVPADIVVCATSEEDHSCYVETKTLDGEINLKSRYAVPELLFLNSSDRVSEIPFKVEIEPQNTDMYRFNGSVHFPEDLDEDGNPIQSPITLNNVILRGCSVRNTEWVIGLVVMTGFDTKVVLNSGITPSKRSIMEVEMNKMVYVNLAIICIIAIVCAIADSQIEQYYTDRQAYWQFGATKSDDNPRINGLIAFAYSLITFQNFVPISLYITFEVVRTIQAILIFEDTFMYYEPNSRRTTAKSWNLSDELGQIQYIISDKTGTLTQNLMVFRECFVGGHIFHGGGKAPEKQSEDHYHVVPAVDTVPLFADEKMSEILSSSGEDKDKIHQFLMCLSLCHTVQLSHEDDNGIRFKAESPDEQALVETAANNGYVFCGRHRNTVKLQLPNGDIEKYEVLQTLEFSSARKRMSVVLRSHSDNRILMYSKGADAMIFSRTREDQEPLRQETDKALDEFARKGLRTLCLAMKELSESDYAQWTRKYHEASVAIENREERMEELASKLETGFYLLGATAIEDKLQDGVPDTIADLKRAGINVWVATGDKLETAIAIGYSTQLLARDMNLIIVRGGEYGEPHSAYEQLALAIERFFGGYSEMDELKHSPPDGGASAAEAIRRRGSMISQVSLVGEDNGQRPGGFALVIDGNALTHVFEEEYSRELLLHVASKCRAVVCCRVSPLQKALIVKMVRNGLGVITLAVGDGANDVSMIQAAHVGVGIAGEEGLQAVNSSDYAIGQFRYLKRLILVHGHWSYYRNSKLINLFFYKQVVHSITLFWFQIYCAWSTTQAIDYVYILLWNAIWTVAAVVGIGIFDRNLSDRVLMDIPELFEASRKRTYFGMWRFTVYMMEGVLQGTILYFFFMYFYDSTSIRSDGYDVSMYEATTPMLIAQAMVANLYCGIETLAWTWWIVFAVFIGPAILLIFTPIYAALDPETVWTYSYGINYTMWPSIQFWMGSVFCIFLALMPRILYEYFKMLFFPSDVELVRLLDIQDPKHDYINDPDMPGIRAARAYKSESPDNAPDSGSAGGHETYHLAPVASRGSSIHYDMRTGTQSPYRGYSFAASDKPTERPKRFVHALSRLNPRNILSRKKNKRHQYTRARNNEPIHGDEPSTPGYAVSDDNTNMHTYQRVPVSPGMDNRAHYSAHDDDDDDADVVVDDTDSAEPTSATLVSEHGKYSSSSDGVPSTTYHTAQSGANGEMQWFPNAASRTE